ncbi:hypothetical protein C352_05318 [Cryptococcus neoformans CHC193]|nr:hypothetical protein C352_05318 [Cryptococcus neoformans var. grubii CHC193]
MPELPTANLRDASTCLERGGRGVGLVWAGEALGCGLQAG